MLPLDDILEMTNALARVNHTIGLLPSVLGFLRFYYPDFPRDYVPCKNTVNGRFKKGKLEELLIYLFAEICNWSNTDRNLRDVHAIMIGLGYKSYEFATKRYRQMIENAKKDLKQNPRICNRIRSLHSKVKNHKPIFCKEYSRTRRMKFMKEIFLNNEIVPMETESTRQTTISEDSSDSFESNDSPKSTLDFSSESTVESPPTNSTLSDIPLLGINEYDMGNESISNFTLFPDPFEDECLSGFFRYNDENCNPNPNYF